MSCLWNIFRFLLRNFSSFKFIILNMIQLCCRFAHSFKIIRIPQPGWTKCILLSTAQYLRPGRGGEINIAYIRGIDGREPEDFELWDFSEEIICDVQPFARVQISNDFTKDTFYSHFSMHIKSRFLSWVADPWTEVSNVSMLPVQLRKLEVV